MGSERGGVVETGELAESEGGHLTPDYISIFTLREHNSKGVRILKPCGGDSIEGHSEEVFFNRRHRFQLGSDLEPLSEEGFVDLQCLHGRARFWRDGGEGEGRVGGGRRERREIPERHGGGD